jgi:hypothetical protein
MRHLSLIALGLLAATGCVANDDETDGIDDVGVSDGKTDAENPSDCEKAQIVAYLNEDRSSEKLQENGLHSRAADAIVKYRNGADGAYGTEDDDKFDSIDEVDEVAYVGRTAIKQLVEAVADRCANPPADPYADARDVTKAVVKFPEGTLAPTSYDYPDGGEFNLGGTEFWQKWSGGHNPTYSFSEGTDKGRLCMQASAIRFEEIMKAAPEDLVKLNADTNWSGSFFNWNDDYSGPGAFGDASGARLWAWRTTLIKWISQTAKDGSCHLPTLDMVKRAATACLTTGAGAAGEIQGCQVR